MKNDHFPQNFWALSALVLAILCVPALAADLQQPLGFGGGDCTVTFYNGETAVKAATVAKSTLLAVADCPEEPTMEGSVFAGWYREVDAETKATNYTVADNSFIGTEFQPKYDAVTVDGDYYAVWVPAETAALVTNGTAVELLTSVPDALTGTVGTRYKLLRDSCTPITVAANEVAVLDLNGCQIQIPSSGNSAILRNWGTLSVQNSSIKPAKLANTTRRYYGILCENGSTMPMLQDITLVTTNGGIRQNGGGAIGTIRNCILQSGNLNLLNCSIEQLRNCTMKTTGGNCISRTGIEQLENCSLTAKYHPIFVGDQPIHIISGSFTSTKKSPALRFGNRGVTFAPGKTMGAADETGTSTVVDGFTVYFYNDAAAVGEPKVWNAQFCPAGTRAVWPAEIPTKAPDADNSYLFQGWQDANGQTVTQTEPPDKAENISFYATFMGVPRPSVAKVGNREYPSIQDAIAAIEGGTGSGTVTLLADVTLLPDAGHIRVSDGKNIVLDFAGHKITGDAYPWNGVIENNGTLMLTSTGGRGTLQAASDHPGCLIKNHQGYEMVLEGLTLLGGNCAVRNEGNLKRVENCSFQPNAGQYAISNGGSVGEIQKCVLTEGISSTGLCIAGEHYTAASIGTIREVTIGSMEAPAAVGICNGAFSTLATVEDCTVVSEGAAIATAGSPEQPGRVTVKSGRYCSIGNKPVEGVGGDAVITLGGGSFRGGVSDSGVVYAPDCKLGTADADGWQTMEKTVVLTPEGSPATAVLAGALCAGKTKVSAVAAVPSTQVVLDAPCVASMTGDKALEIAVKGATIDFAGGALEKIKTGADSGAVVLTVTAESEGIAGTGLVLSLTKIGEIAPLAFGTATVTLPVTAAAFPLAVYQIDGAHRTRVDATAGTAALTFTATAFGSYAVVEEKPVLWLSMGAPVTGTVLNPGESFTVDVMAADPSAGRYGSVAFTPVLPAGVTLICVESPGRQGTIQGGVVTLTGSSTELPVAGIPLATLTLGATTAATHSISAVAATVDGKGIEDLAGLAVSVTGKTDVSDRIVFADGRMPYTGSGLAFEQATFAGTAAGAAMWSYTYGAVSGTLEPVSGRPLTVGSYTVTAAYADADNEGSQSAALTVTKAESVVTPENPSADPAGIRYGDTLSLRAAVSPARLFTAGENQVEFFCGAASLGTAAVVNGVATLSVDTTHRLLKIGDNTITATYGGSTNLKLNEAKTNTVNMTLRPKTLTAEMLDEIEDKTFAGSQITPTDVTVKEGDRTLARDIDYTIKDYGANLNAGTGTVTLTGRGYYTGDVTKCFSIVPRNSGAVTAAATVCYYDTEAKTISLAAAVADLQAGGETPTYQLTAVDDRHQLLQAGTAVDASGVLTFGVRKGLPAAPAVQTATVRVTVTGLTNYRTVTATVTLTVAGGRAVAVSMEGIGLTHKVYDGVALSYDGAASGSWGAAQPYPGAFDYSWYQAGTKLEGAPKQAGVYTLKAEVADPAYTGEASRQVTISKAAVTVTADNKTIYTGGALPAYTATAVGLAAGETIHHVTCTAVGAATGRKATFAIVPAGGTISGGNENYSISYRKGTLTVSVDTGAIDAALDRAIAAKSGVCIGTYPPVPAGVPFVTDAEMGALTRAIAVAVSAKGTVTDADTASTAAAALDRAVQIFTAAIKTGAVCEGGGAVPSPAPKPETPPPVVADIRVKAETKGDTATGSVTEKEISAALASAQTGGKVEVQIKVEAAADTKAVQVAIPGKSIAAVAEGKAENLVISTPVAEIKLDTKALQTIAEQAGAEVKISAAIAETQQVLASMPPEQRASLQKEIGSRPVYTFRITSGDAEIADFAGGNAQISVPYTLRPGEKAAGVCVFFVDGAGKLNRLTGSYDGTQVTFRVPHFSIYAVGYDRFVDWDSPFSDVADGIWCYSDVSCVVQNQILNGTTATTFSPAKTMTRGMFVTALGRLAQAELSADSANPFTDVPAEAYYRGYVGWAVEQGITGGVTATRFAPDDPITREQMAALLYRYIKPAPPGGKPTYADAVSLSAWAVEPARFLQETGILTGKSGNRFDPLGLATRAEAAAVLRRFMEFAR
ncbi:MAG: S-layer homology domain-containing protein [Oscillospiraceae bacterium]